MQVYLKDGKQLVRVNVKQFIGKWVNLLDEDSGEQIKQANAEVLLVDKAKAYLEQNRAVLHIPAGDKIIRTRVAYYLLKALDDGHLKLREAGESVVKTEEEVEEDIEAAMLEK